MQIIGSVYSEVEKELEKTPLVLRFTIALLNLIKFIVTASGFAIMQVPESALAAVIRSLIVLSGILLCSPLCNVKDNSVIK